MKDQREARDYGSFGVLACALQGRIVLFPRETACAINDSRHGLVGPRHMLITSWAAEGSSMRCIVLQDADGAHLGFMLCNPDLGPARRLRIHGHAFPGRAIRHLGCGVVRSDGGRLAKARGRSLLGNHFRWSFARPECPPIYSSSWAAQTAIGVSAVGWIGRSSVAPCCHRASIKTLE